MAQLLTQLTDSARTIVYNMVVAALKADTTLSAVIPPGQWTTYTEDAPRVRNSPLENNGYPAIRILPFGLPATQEANTLQNSWFAIGIAITTAGLDVRDLLNLWGAVEAALFPGDGSKTLANNIRAALAAAGAAAGKNIGSIQTINLGVPAVAPSTDQSQFMTAEGNIVVPMTVPK